MGRRLRGMMRTRAGWEAIPLRLGVAADAVLDGARAADLHAMLGTSRIAWALRASATWTAVWGWVELVAAAMLVVGMWTRPAAAGVIVLAVAALLHAGERIETLDAGLQLTRSAAAVVLISAAGVLVWRGGGRLSVDGLVRGGRRR